MAAKTDLEVRLRFPNIDKVFSYRYENADMEHGYVERSFKAFYMDVAPVLFALYGYAPMDVEIYTAGENIFAWHSCYQETLWGAYFDEGGRAWYGRFNPFLDSLSECRRAHERYVKDA